MSNELETMLAQASGELKSFITRQATANDELTGAVRELKTRILDVEQKQIRNPRGDGDFGSGGDPVAEMAKFILESDGAKAFVGGSSKAVSIRVPAAMFKSAITATANSTSGTVNALYAADRRPDIVLLPRRRLTIRDLFTAFPTNSGMVEFCRENVLTNNAGPQGAATMSPQTTGEGELKNESSITYDLAQVVVATLAHWVPASKQILQDAPMLQRVIGDTLLYGLKLKEESELLTGDGTAGSLSGLIQNSTAFTGGSTNQTMIDTLAKGAGQLVAADLQPSGFILNASDWLSLTLLKDTTGRYLLGDPGSGVPPQLWGLPVVPTNSMTAGKFIALDAQRAGFIADREDANIQISESHADFFVRNLVALRCEERLAFGVERSAAIIYGNTGYAG